MLEKRKKDLLADRLDSAEHTVIRLGSLSDAEAEAVASSPYLFERIRARIEAEAAKPDSGTSGALPPNPWRAWVAWSLGGFVGGFAKLKIGLAILALAVSTAFWIDRMRSMDAPMESNSASPPIQTAGISACALSNVDRCAISTSDVLQLVIASGARRSN